jgi:hypothetical protein
MCWCVDSNRNAWLNAGNSYSYQNTPLGTRTDFQHALNRRRSGVIPPAPTTRTFPRRLSKTHPYCSRTLTDAMAIPRNASAVGYCCLWDSWKWRLPKQTPLYFPTHERKVFHTGVIAWCRVLGSVSRASLMWLSVVLVVIFGGNQITLDRRWRNAKCIHNFYLREETTWGGRSSGMSMFFADI